MRNLLIISLLLLWAAVSLHAQTSEGACKQYVLEYFEQPLLPELSKGQLKVTEILTLGWEGQSTQQDTMAHQVSINGLDFAYQKKGQVETYNSEKFQALINHEEGLYWLNHGGQAIDYTNSLMDSVQRNIILQASTMKCQLEDNQQSMTFRTASDYFKATGWYEISYRFNDGRITESYFLQKNGESQAHLKMLYKRDGFVQNSPYPYEYMTNEKSLSEAFPGYEKIVYQDTVSK